ncbi:hypothetical protein K3495_g545 [Podosphaera aphanis]|nr:hypothetical protein K3495_g545 [Podosphaera aphanis]
MKKILVINPNSSPVTTNALDVVVHDFLAQRSPISAHIETYTAPSGPPSIDNQDDALMSAKAVMADLQFKLGNYDAYLVACYCAHPLVSMLTAVVPPRTHVMGIFDASLATALMLLPLDGRAKFGILGTDTPWETALTTDVHQFCGITGDARHARFAGVQNVGLSAAELQHTASDDVHRRVQAATKVFARDCEVRVICLGWAGGHPGLREVVRDALREELGDTAESIYIVDGFQAGIGMLQTLMETFPAGGAPR